MKTSRGRRGWRGVEKGGLGFGHLAVAALDDLVEHGTQDCWWQWRIAAAVWEYGEPYVGEVGHL